MYRALTAVSLVFAVSLSSFADEPKNGAEGDGQIIKQLLQRINQLEKRVTELESRPVAPYTVAPSVTPSSVAPPVYTLPRPLQPTPALPPYSQGKPVPPTPTPPSQPDGSMPGNWQKFKFNGQYFYIIPLNQFEPRVTQQGYQHATPQHNHRMQPNRK